MRDVNRAVKWKKARGLGQRLRGAPEKRQQEKVRKGGQSHSGSARREGSKASANGREKQKKRNGETTRRSARAKFQIRRAAPSIKHSNNTLERGVHGVEGKGKRRAQKTGSEARGLG